MFHWRLIDTGSLGGPQNMAVDEALLACFREGSAPVLRLYGWSPAALSTGRFQNPAEVLDLARCAADGVPVVRRVTGGGVIYHADELTYSVVCSERHLGAAGVRESFRRLTSFLLEFYRRLGLDACYACDGAGDERLGIRTDFCFAGKENYDILVGGRKIGGNAQRRLRRLVFQHGSIPLQNRTGVGEGYLLHPPESPSAAAALADFGVDPAVDALKSELLAAFRESVGVLVPSSLSAAEAEQAERLLREKYLADAWNLQGKEAR
ncbi:MAG TPA: lipoate--protein ligase family protein [Verrucomicrobiae bacterium]|nr:lipoate--protein ligase family protein [Verrucomicrobiae bacterium]